MSALPDELSALGRATWRSARDTAQRSACGRSAGHSSGWLDRLGGGLCSAVAAASLLVAGASLAAPAPPTPSGLTAPAPPAPSGLAAPAPPAPSGLAAPAPPAPLRRASVPLIAAFGEAMITPPLPVRSDLVGCAGRSSHATWTNPFSALPPELAPRNLRFTWATAKGVIAMRDVFVLEAGHAVHLDIIPEQQPRLELDWRILRCGAQPKDGLRLVVTVADRHGEVRQVVPLDPGALRRAAREQPDAEAATSSAPDERPRKKRRSRRGEKARDAEGDAQRGRRTDPGFVPLVVDLPLEAGFPARVSLEIQDGRGERADELSGADEGSGRRERRRTPRVRRRSLDDTVVIGLAEPAITGIPDETSGLLRGGDSDPEHPRAVGADVNVLWVVIDAVRSDALGPRRTFSLPDATPALDRVFAEGTSFGEAWSLGNSTRTSTVAMLASAPPSLGGFHSHSWGFTKGRLATFYASRPPLITRLLEQHGWRVAHFGHNLFVFGGETIGVDHGFPRVLDFKSIPADAVQASAAAIAFMTENRDRRWALMLNYTAPHTPYRPPEAFEAMAQALPGPERLGGVLPRSYFGELMWVDHNIGPVFRTLKDLGLDERTLVIVTADHGELMEPHHACFSGLVGQPCAFNHSLTVYGGELHVPLALRLPGQIRASQVITEPVSHLDLAPTILELLELPPAPRHAGRSLAPALRGEPLTPRPVLSDGRLATAFRDGTWKLIVHAPSDDVAPLPRKVAGSPSDLAPHELFDLAGDPREQTNLAYIARDRTRTMLAGLQAFRSGLAERLAGSPGPARPHPTGPSDPTDTGLRAQWSTQDLRVMLQASPAREATLSLRLDLVRAAGRGTDGARHSQTADDPTGPPELPRCLLATGCRSTPEGTLEITLTAAPGVMAEAIIRVPPSRAPQDLLRAEAVLDGRPLPPNSLRLGPYGLSYFAEAPWPPTGTWLEAARGPGSADAAPRPFLAPSETAVYLTTHHLDLGGGGPTGAAGAGDADRARTRRSGPELSLPEAGASDPDVDKRLGRDVRRVLRELGYSR